MMSCLGFGTDEEERERQPLLPRYNDDTSLQTRLHEKLHSYQMLRAFTKGYMPTNAQAIVHLRSLLSADILNPNTSNLSQSGRMLVQSSRLWIKQLIEFLQHKNADDQIQDFIWYLAKSRLEVDVADITGRASRATSKAHASAAYQSLQTVGSLLLTNSDFRLFLADLGTVGREVLQDTAFALSDASKHTAQKIGPTEEKQDALKQKPANGDATETPATSSKELQEELGTVGEALVEGASEVVDGAATSIGEHMQGAEQETLIHRLKQTVSGLRKRTDYSESVSTLSHLIRRYLLIYSHAASDTMQAIEDDSHTNPEADRALHNFWLFVTSLGNREKWTKVEKTFNSLLEDGKTDPNFDELVKQIGNLVQDMLMGPDFFDNAEERFQALRKKSNELTAKSSVRDDVEALFTALYDAYNSVINDQDIKKLLHTTNRVASILSPGGHYTNSDLVSDSIHVFVPMVIQGIQYLPIPRVEISTPAADLLLENLIIEPGKTVHHSSFLPYKLNVSTQNNVEVYKARNGTTASMKSFMQIRVSGLSIAADEVGYWLRLHSGLLRLVSEGLAGFHLDQRGIDIMLDVEIGRERLEELVTLRNVRVNIHHLNYTLSKSRFACLAWLLKPLIRPIVRKALEYKMAAAIKEGLHTLNRELVFARERFRAARIANPADLWSFIRAVAARLQPAPDWETDARIGVKPGGGVFRGRYAPGSLVRMWENEAQDAEQRVFEYERSGWKNGIFDLKTTAA